jgi:hypothetical protein
MANTFKRYASRNVGTSAVTIGSYTVGASTQTTLIGLTVANTTASVIAVDVQHNDATNDTYIVKGAPVPAGSSIVIVGGDQKIVMETGDSIKVTSDTATSADAYMSLLEIT